MADRIPPTQLDSSFDEQFAERLHAHRSDSQVYLTDQQELLSKLNIAIADQMQSLIEQHQRDEQELAELSQRQILAEQSERELAASYEAFEASKMEHKVNSERLAREQSDLQQTRAQLEDERLQLADERAKTHEQRRHIAHELTNQRSRQREEIDAEKTEVEAARNELDEQRSSFEIERQQAALQDSDGIDEEEFQKFQQQQQEQIQLSAQLADKQTQLDARLAELDTDKQLAERDRRTLTGDQAEYEAQSQRLTKHRDEIEMRRNELDEQRRELNEERTKTRSQRRRIAAEFKSSREKKLAEFAQQQEGLQRRAAEIESQSTEVQSKADNLAASTAELEARTEAFDATVVDTESSATEISQCADALETLRTELDERRDQLDRRDKEMVLDNSQLEQQASEAEHLKANIADLEQQNKSLQAQSEAAAEEAARAMVGSDADSQELQQQLHGQIRELKQALEQALEQASEQGERNTSDGVNEEEYNDLQKRFEMAISDLRELKSCHADLEEQLANDRSSPGESPEASSGFDWEAQKQKMFESLDDDFSENEEADHQQRLTIEGTISITDEILAQKDVEINELKQLLGDQSSQLGSVAVGAAAIGAMFDEDELILQERDNLRAQKEEWRDKLRKAEVDISLERAKISREKIELEAKLQGFEADKAKYIQSEKKNSDGTPVEAKPGGRRWLSRLGLKDSNSDE